MEMPEGFKRFDKLYAKDGELPRKALELMKEMAEALAEMGFEDEPDPASRALKKFKDWK